MTRIVAIRHTKKAQLPEGLPPELYADQPLSEEGMVQAVDLGQLLKSVFGPPALMFAGNAQRTVQTATIIHKITGSTCPIQTLWGLYHQGSDHQGDDRWYPGFEDWDWSRWQTAAVSAFDAILTANNNWRYRDATIFAVATSVAIASFECHLHGIHDDPDIAAAIIAWPEDGKRYSVFEHDLASGFRYVLSG